MATFSAASNVSGYDFRQFNLARLDTAEVISASNSLIRSRVVPNQYLDLTGSFVYDGEGYLVGNSLSGYAEVMNGITLWSFSGMTMSVYNFSYYYFYNDNTGFLTEAMAGNDTITGSAYSDYLMGFWGNDTINGGNGDDWIDGGLGADVLNGGEGNDTYLYDGTDTINDSGSSTSDVLYAAGTVDLSTMTGIENVQLSASSWISVTGSNANNIIWGNAYGTPLSGGGGNDTIYGYGGDDTLIGGTGDDMLYGGFGNDTYGIDSVNDVMFENHLQILWRNKVTGENYLWDADGADVAINGYLSVAYVPLGWEIVGAADFNGDGTDDILWRNSQTGQNHLWHMTGAVAFGQDLSRSVIPLEWKVVATADFDGDGKSDVLWRNSRTGENHLWHMNDTNFVNGVNLSRAVIPLEWDVVGAADFDNDGHVDILWRNSRTGENHLWYMNDSTFLAGVNLSVPVIPVAWKIEALRDFNDDGHVDILWRNSRTGENHLWYMNNSTVTAGYNLSIAAVSLDWELVGTIDQDSWGGNDTVQSSLANYTLPERLENLTLTAGAGNINGTGNEVANQLTGNSGDNTLHGLAGNDTIEGGDGNDTLYGDDGNDTISDFGGNDTINGGIGNDTVTDWLGNDTINGGDGDDFIRDHGGTSNTLNGGNGNDTIESGSSTGADIIDGGDGNDTITDFGGSDIINGGAGNDIITDQDGNDTLDGGDGNDRISGGSGSDILTGGAGADTFVWGAGGGIDHITDFQTGVGGDVINLATRSFMEVFSGQTITASNVSDYVQVLSGAGGSSILIDSDGAVGGASFGLVLLLDGVPSLNLADLYTNGNLIIS